MNDAGALLEGIIVENSLKDGSVLNKLKILKSWDDGDWRLHRVALTYEEAVDLGTGLIDGPWYMHFWADTKDDVLVVFNNATFEIKYSDKNTWKVAIQHGTKKGIPLEQLDFVIE